jgi:hypothetical protein
MDDYEHLRKICIEEICNPEKLFEHCNCIISNKPFMFPNNDWVRICGICSLILKDPYYKDKSNHIKTYDLLPGVEETVFKTIDEEYSKIVKEYGALTVDFTESRTHFLNKNFKLQNLKYPFLRVLCAENYENIKEICVLLLNSHNIKEIYSKCYQIDVNKLEGVSSLQLKVILLATKIE